MIEVHYGCFFLRIPTVRKVLAGINLPQRGFELC